MLCYLYLNYQYSFFKKGFKNAVKGLIKVLKKYAVPLPPRNLALDFSIYLFLHVKEPKPNINLQVQEIKIFMCFVLFMYSQLGTCYICKYCLPEVI